MIQPEQNAALKDKFKSCNGEYLGIRNDLEVDGRSEAVRMRTVSVTSSVDKNIMTVTERVSLHSVFNPTACHGRLAVRWAL